MKLSIDFFKFFFQIFLDIYPALWYTILGWEEGYPRRVVSRLMSLFNFVLWRLRPKIIVIVLLLWRWRAPTLYKNYTISACG